MKYIDESFGVEPWSDDDYEWPPDEKDEAGDACQHWDNASEDRRISNR